MGADRYGDIIINIDIDKVNLFGENYISQYVIYEAKRREKETTLQYYITDCLKIIADNTARYSGGSSLKLRYSDIINSNNNHTQESGQEVKERLLNKMRKDFEVM